MSVEALQPPIPELPKIPLPELRLVEPESSISFRRYFLAKRVVSVAVLETLSDVAAQQMEGAIYPIGDPALGTGFDLSVVKRNRKTVDSRFKDLVAEYQGCKARESDPTIIINRDIMPSDLEESINEKERSILEQVKSASDEEIISIEKRVATDEKKLGKNVPDAQEIMDSMLPDAREIEPKLSEDQKKGAEMLFHVAFMNEAIRDMKSTVSRKAFRKRDKAEVTQDLTNIVTAYQAIHDRKDPVNEVEIASQSRVMKLLQDLESKKNAIYRQTAKVPEEEMKSFVQQADLTAQQLMMKRLHGDEQRELLAGMTGHEVNKVSHQYRRTLVRNGINFVAENGLAIGAGFAAQKALGAADTPAWLLDPVSSGLEVGMLAAFALGGISEAKSIRNAGYSVNVPALYLQDLVSRITTSKIGQDVSAAVGYAGSLYTAEAAVWGPLYTWLVKDGYNFQQLFGIALGANLAGIGYQGWLGRHRRRQSEKYDPGVFQKERPHTEEVKDEK